MELIAVTGLPEIGPGDDLAELIDRRFGPDPDDVVLVASTIVSKAEGRTVDLEGVRAGPRAERIADRLAARTGEPKDPRFAEIVIRESEELLMTTPFLLTATPFGHICVNAGIDRSNTGGADVLLLPERPSESAGRIRRGLAASPPVIVTDTCGRPFRHGQRGVAIGWDGMPASRDWRGERDRDGRELTVTVENVIDELAAAANLVAGEGAGGSPVVIARGFEFGPYEGSDSHFRDPGTDYVRRAIVEWADAR